MIWVRRLLTIPLGLLFLFILAVTLLFLRAGETFLEPGFYAEQLAGADVYSFLADDLLPSALEELWEKDPDFFSDDLEENPLVTLSLTPEDMVAAVRRALPPSWMQEQVEQALEEAGGYLSGQGEGFQVTIDAATRVKTAEQELKTLIRKAQFYRLLFDQVVLPQVDQVLKEEGKLPFGVPLTSQEIVDAVQRVAPEEWVKDEVERALDELTAYAIGEQEGFEISVQLSGRAGVALQEVKDLLRRANFFELLFDEVVDPMLEGQLALITQLPFGVTVTQEEVKAALRELVPPAWLEEQVLGVIDEAGPYLTGKADSFRVVVPLAERKEVALMVIEDLTRKKLEELVNALPTCGAGELLFTGGAPLRDELPLCVPFGIPLWPLIDSLDIDIASTVAGMIGSQIPDHLTYTQADLRRALSAAGGEDTLKVLDDLREVISQGWRYTDADLREDLLRSQGKDAVERLEDVRDALRGGWTYTDADLRQYLLDAGGGDTLDKLDTFRSALSTARSLMPLSFLLWGLPLGAIGILGGRRWWSKVAWAAVFLAIASAIVFLASGLGYERMSQRLVSEFRAREFGELEGTALLAAEKALSIAERVADDFLSGIVDYSQTLLLVSLAVLGVSLAWGMTFGRPRARRP